MIEKHKNYTLKDKQTATCILKETDWQKINLMIQLLKQPSIEWYIPKIIKIFLENG